MDYAKWQDVIGEPGDAGQRRVMGTPCKAAGIGRGGRCKNHGGLSTGPKTAAGKTRCYEGRMRYLERRKAALTIEP
jgi:hypothetical protein